jgi:hypothetical protein
MAEVSGQAFDPEYLTVFLSLAPGLYRTYATAPEEFLLRELEKIALPIWLRQFD